VLCFFSVKIYSSASETCYLKEHFLSLFIYFFLSKWNRGRECTNICVASLSLLSKTIVKKSKNIRPMHQVTVVNEFTPYSSQHQIKILKNCSMRARYITQSAYRKYICRSLGIPLPLPTPHHTPHHNRNPRESVAQRVGSTGPDVFHQLGTSHALPVEL